MSFLLAATSMVAWGQSIGSQFVATTPPETVTAPLDTGGTLSSASYSGAKPGQSLSANQFRRYQLVARELRQVSDQYMVKAGKEETPSIEATIREGTLGAVGWFAFAGGSIGLTAGQTLRVSIVNLSASSARALCGLWQNPEPLSVNEARCCLPHETHKLRPGEAWDCDLEGSALSAAMFDKAGRAQIRALVRSSSPVVAVNLEVFDTKTGRTSAILPLREMAHRQ